MIIRNYIDQTKGVQIKRVIDAWFLTLHGASPRAWTGYSAAGKCYYHFRWTDTSIILTVDGEDAIIWGAIASPEV